MNLAEWGATANCEAVVELVTCTHTRTTHNAHAFPDTRLPKNGYHSRPYVMHGNTNEQHPSTKSHRLNLRARPCTRAAVHGAAAHHEMQPCFGLCSGQWVGDSGAHRYGSKQQSNMYDILSCIKWISLPNKANIAAHPIPRTRSSSNASAIIRSVHLI